MIYNDPALRRRKAEKVTLTFTGMGTDNLLYVEIDGVQYVGGESIEVDAETVVLCYISDAVAYNKEVLINGSVAAQGASGESLYYSYTITKNATIRFSVNPIVATITITET